MINNSKRQVVHFCTRVWGERVGGQSEEGMEVKTGRLCKKVPRGEIMKQRGEEEGCRGMKWSSSLNPILIMHCCDCMLLKHGRQGLCMCIHMCFCMGAIHHFTNRSKITLLSHTHTNTQFHSMPCTVSSQNCKPTSTCEALLHPHVLYKRNLWQNGFQY